MDAQFSDSSNDSPMLRCSPVPTSLYIPPQVSVSEYCRHIDSFTPLFSSTQQFLSSPVLSPATAMYPSPPTEQPASDCETTLLISDILLASPGSSSDSADLLLHLAAAPQDLDTLSRLPPPAAAHFPISARGILSYADVAVPRGAASANQDHFMKFMRAQKRKGVRHNPIRRNLGEGRGGSVFPREEEREMSGLREGMEALLDDRLPELERADSA
ncbi:hypothetical protein HDU98_003920 [Podochytrium sp. JEL0797]|nr:hypothetical protein HDU98_003920 [Podochytrium sp. JEL0797]